MLGGTKVAGLYSLVTAGELLLLTCRLLELLPAGAPDARVEEPDAEEHIISV
jgi:hypothetical protein